MVTRVFVAAKLEPEQEIVLASKISRHLLRVLRLTVDAELLVFSGGKEFHAVITAVKNNYATVKLGAATQSNNESSLQIYLGQGIARGSKMDLLIQKAVELGVTKITALSTEHCNVKLSGERLTKRLQHWQAVAISATEQSKRCWVPKIRFASMFEWLPTVSGLRLVLDPSARDTLSTIPDLAGCITLLVGPEGGLSPKEVTWAKHHDFLPIRLGPRVLRTETAALAAISALQTKWGDY